MDAAEFAAKLTAAFERRDFARVGELVCIEAHTALADEIASGLDAETAAAWDAYVSADAAALSSEIETETGRTLAGVLVDEQPDLMRGRA